MRTLVTGAGGQLGSELGRLLEGQDCHLFDRSQLDITDAAATAALVRELEPDLIINAAAFTKVDLCEAQPDTAFAVNAQGVRHLAQAARMVGAVLIQPSTDYVFDGSAGRPYAEQAPTEPLNVYGASKLAGELSARANPRHYVVRTSWLFGARGPNFVTSILLQLDAGRQLRVVDDQIGSPTYAFDLAATMLSLARTGIYGTYHACNTGSTSWFGLATEIVARCGAKADVEPISSNQHSAAARRPGYSVLATDLLAQVGVRPMRSWQEALSSYLGCLGRLGG